MGPIEGQPNAGQTQERQEEHTGAAWRSIASVVPDHETPRATSPAITAATPTHSSRRTCSAETKQCENDKAGPPRR